jgi:hypothetical protein
VSPVKYEVGSYITEDDILQPYYSVMTQNLPQTQQNSHLPEVKGADTDVSTGHPQGRRVEICEEVESAYSTREMLRQPL